YQLAVLHRTEQVENANRDKALELAQKAAAKSKPNEWKAHELLAAIYRDSGDMDKAVAELKEALRASGGNARYAKKYYEAWGGKPEAPPEKPAETPPAEKPAETPPAEKPAEKPAETPPAEKPAEKPAETPPAEKPAEKPAEEPKNDMGGGSGDMPK